jgi:hypothetical protein
MEGDGGNNANELAAVDQIGWADRFELAGAKGLGHIWTTNLKD